jgi:aspartyl-tRNA(Asn)/glutamyl-tRNA(Gln) amidotransferase subunit A
MPDLADLPAVELVRLFAAGDARPSEALESVLRRVDVWEPRLGAFTQLLEADARIAASESDARYARGKPLGALDGVPVTVKENIATAGDPYRMGTAAMPPAVSEADAPIAARLREAGATLFAKTTMPDFGMLSSGVSSLPRPTTRNPWNLEWNTGGSSAGAGAAAAAGVGTIHIGTDIGGSVRLPANWCGVAGFKPSFGRVPVDPPYYGRCAGPIARSVADLALAMSAISLPDERDHMSLPPSDLPWTAVEPVDPAGLRIGVCIDAGAGLPATPDVSAVAQDAARALDAAGAVVQPIGPLIDGQLLDDLDRFWRMRSHLELRGLGEERSARALPYIREWAAPAAGYSAEQVFVAFSAMDAIAVAAGRAFAEVDFLVSPVAPIGAFAADAPGPIGPRRAMDHIGFTVPFNMSGQPAISVPWSRTADGRPVGVQLAGRRHRDLDVLALGLTCERLRPPQPAWPG